MLTRNAFLPAIRGQIIGREMVDGWVKWRIAVDTIYKRERSAHQVLLNFVNRNRVQISTGDAWRAQSVAIGARPHVQVPPTDARRLLPHYGRVE